MKVAFIITDMTREGGTERVTQILCDHLKQSFPNWEITIISCFRNNKGLSFPLTQNVDIKYLLNKDYYVSHSKAKRLARLFEAEKALRKYLKLMKFDVIISQAFLPSFLMFLSNFKGKWIVCEHFKYELYSALSTKVRNFVYTHADQVVTLTDTDGAKFKNIGIDTVTIPNMITFPIQENISNGKRMVSVGRLHYQKGYDILIPAMVDVFKRFPDWNLDIYGEGEDREMLTNLISQCNLTEKIKLRGYSDNIRRELLNSDLCLVSSRFEGLPMSIIEALALGVPVVSFDCPEGPSDLLKNEAGILVPPEDGRKLSEAIIRAIGDVDLRKKLRQNGYRNIVNYTPEVIINKWKQLFEKLVK